MDDRRYNGVKVTKKPQTGLEFEVSDSGKGLVFDSEARINPASNRARARANNATKNEEFLIPGSYLTNEINSNRNYMSSPRRTPMYVPRFTEVSERYRMQADPRIKGAPAPESAQAPARPVAPAGNNAAKVAQKNVRLVQRPVAPHDATTEADETRKVRRVVIRQAKGEGIEPKDESIKVLKFATDPAPAQPVAKESPEEELERLAREYAEKKAALLNAETERELQLRAAEERAAQERAAQERAAQERAEAERIARERAEAERIARERAEAERVAAEEAARERALYERIAQMQAAAAAKETPKEEPVSFGNIPIDDYSTDSYEYEAEADEQAPIESEAGKKAPAREFTKPIQRDEVKDSFLDSIISVRIRLISASVIFALLLTLNVLKLFSVDVVAMMFGSATFAWAIVDLQLALCVALFAIPEIVRSAKKLLSNVISPELVIIPSAVVLITYTIVACTSDTASYPVFGIFVALQALAAIIATHHRLAAEFAAFKIISRNTVKNVLDKRLTRELPRENLALDGAVDEYKSKVARMFRAAFVSDFFFRINKTMENSFNVIIMYLVSLGVALVTGIVSYFVGDGSVLSGVGSFTLVFLLSFPAFSMLVHKLPYHASSRESMKDYGTFVGETSLYSCADIDVIAYDDTEVFGPEDVSIKKVHLYGKGFNASKAMKQMYSIFSVVGGPLDRVFTSAVDRKGPSASGIVIEDDGISGTLEGNKICVGTLEYMIRHNIRIPVGDEKVRPAANDSTKMLYGAENGEVYVKFFIRYSFSEEFTMLLPSLKSRKIVPLIYTRDPNITSELVRMLTSGQDLIRVMKKHVPRTAEEKVYRRVSAGIVTLGEKTNAINMVLLAKRYTSFQSTLSATELFAMLAGAVLAIIFSVSGTISVPVIALSALQVVWGAYLYIRTARAFSTKKKNRGN